MSQDLARIFRQVDKDHSGYIGPGELYQALSQGVWRPFNMETVRMMVVMYDRDGNGVIDFNEFRVLWTALTQWRQVFMSYDLDRSGRISKSELINCLSQMGYRLSDRFYNLIYAKFDRTRTGQLTFDDFIPVCITLQTLTYVFAAVDIQRRGVITISYETFLSMVVGTRI